MLKWQWGENMTNNQKRALSFISHYLKTFFVITFILLSFKLNIIPNRDETNVTIDDNYFYISNNNISLLKGENHIINIELEGTNHNITYDVINEDIINIEKVDLNTFKVTALNEGHSDIIISNNNNVSYIINFHVDAVYENVNYTNKLITTAFNEIGYREKASKKSLNSKTANLGNKNYTKYGAWYGINPGKWCAMFVSWCANEAGIDDEIIPSYASVSMGMDWFKNQKLFKHKKNYTPKPGDIIFFKNAGASHTGIVIGCANGFVYTIEGNTNNTVAKRYYKLNYSKITGYGTPNYPKYYSFDHNYDYSDATSGHSGNTV